jgi:hypothetical protein
VGDVQLVVRADDFGMCHAVNAGVVAAWRDGIVTQTTTMVPCPWFPEAIRLVRETGLPSGVHLTLTAEWTNLRWRPLTRGASLRADDGAFPRTRAEAFARWDPVEVLAEVGAQMAAFTAQGGAATHVDSHMGVLTRELADALIARYGLPCLDVDAVVGAQFDSVGILGGQPDKQRWLLDHLAGLGRGRHLLVGHPAVGGPELAALTDGPESRALEHGRAGDLAVLTSRATREAVARLGIDLVALGPDGELRRAA